MKAIVERTERVRAWRGGDHRVDGARPSSRARRRPPTGWRRSDGQSPRYEIRQALYQGGMGAIYLARLIGPDGFSRKVVLKGLLDRLDDDDVSTQLFLREARLMARLDHPNIVRVFDLPVLDDRMYLAMEHVAGRNLHQIIQRSPQTPLPLRLVLYAVAEALRGLHYAHAVCDERGRHLGLVHRDVSPGNVLISFFGEVKLCDFGIARFEGAPQLTAPQSIRGKARYVSPEQIRGSRASALSDVYAAGVVLAEAIRGRPLWDYPTIPETLLAIISEPRDLTLDRILEDRPEVPGLRAALRGALAQRPEDRFGTALQFAETLEAVGERLGPRVTPVELGLALRKVFHGDEDVPGHDGFGSSGFPRPDFADDARGTEADLRPEGRRLSDLVDALEALDPEDSERSDTRRMSTSELRSILDVPLSDLLEDATEITVRDMEEVNAPATRQPTLAEIPLSQPMLELSSAHMGTMSHPPEPTTRGRPRARVRAPEEAKRQDALSSGEASPRRGHEGPASFDGLCTALGEEQASLGRGHRTMARDKAPRRFKRASMEPAPSPVEGELVRPGAELWSDPVPHRSEFALRPPQRAVSEPRPLDSVRQVWRSVDEPQGDMMVLLAGIVIGAALAISGCLIAILAGP